MKEELAKKRCLPCDEAKGHLMAEEMAMLMKNVPEWKLEEFHHITRVFHFKNFAEAFVFVNKVGALADSEGHHPDIEFGWGYVKIKLTTHAVDGLTENDFIVATKIDLLRH